MDLTPANIVGVVGGGTGLLAAIVGFIKWSLTRNIATADEANKKRDDRLSKLESAVVLLADRMTRFEARAESNSKDIGRLESKVETLQTELRQRDAHLVDMIHEVTRENAKGLADLRAFLEEYRLLTHERLNEITRLLSVQNEELREENERLKGGKG